MAQPRIEYEKKVTVDFVLSEASVIWNKVKSGGPMEDLMKSVQTTHPQFYTSYPVVVRYMCIGVYSPRAMRQYLEGLKVRPWKTETDYLESQIDYGILLYKSKNKRWKRSDVDQLRADMRAELFREHTTFKNTLNSVVEQVETEEARRARANAIELRDYLCGAVQSEDAAEGLTAVAADPRADYNNLGQSTVRGCSAWEQSVCETFTCESDKLLE